MMVRRGSSNLAPTFLILLLMICCIFGQGQNTFFSQDQNIPYQIDISSSKGQQFLELTFTNNFIQLNQSKDTFLCFLVTKDKVSIIDQQSIYSIDQLSSIDFQNCLLQLDQTVLVELDPAIKQVYINPIFIDELKQINFSRLVPIETQFNANFIKKDGLCPEVCNGATCNSLSEPSFNLQNVCQTCPNYYIGQYCQLNYQIYQINNQYQFTFSSKRWKFIRVQVNVPTKLNANYHIVMIQQQTLLQQNFSLLYSQQIRFKSNQEDASYPIIGFDNSQVRNSSSTLDESLTKEYISSVVQQSSIASQNINNQTYEIVFYINLFNNGYQDFNVEFAFYDDQSYQKYQLQYMNLFDLPSWVFYLMMGFAILFFIAILCLVKALVKRYQDEQSQRALLNRRNLEKLNPEIVESHIPKYTFKHIFKAVKKRRDEILKECQQEQAVPSQPRSPEEEEKRRQEQEEMCRKVQERCENILGNGECGICLCNFEYEDECRLTICDHIFHIACFDPWLYKNQNCPYCRTPITEAALKEWKLKTIKYYPLDQSLGSVATIDSKKLNKSDIDQEKSKLPKDNQQDELKHNEQENCKKDKTYDGDVFSADLVKKDIINLKVEKKPIYFHTLSLQSLKQAESPQHQRDVRINKKHATVKLTKDTIQTLEMYFNKSQNQDQNKKSENDVQRKKEKASTFVNPANQNYYNNEPKSAHLAKIMRGHEHVYQDTYATVNQNSPETFIQPFKPVFDFKQNLNNINEIDSSEASTRIRQDSHIYSLNEPFSHNKLFQNHDSSNKLGNNLNYNLNLQDSILKIGMIESPRVEQVHDKQSKSSKFKLTQRGLESNQDLQSIIDLDNEEKDNYQSNNKLQIENKIGQVEHLIDQQQQKNQQQNININLKKQQSANLDFRHTNFFHNREQDKQEQDQIEYEINFIKSKSQKSQTLTSFSPVKLFDKNKGSTTKSNNNIDNLKFN
ncbi:RING finger protein (macronuclear) [Tetrahymena thermophila SB210]|uniref:RING finger protein n=1 Tax=Tetrahymena thermophila (strain SB210) TaxID=312017 RepID=Q23CZ8_TETTS|nr:RING finger protein [Tetrahymena thermophila SB210]EAR94613.2 RING finger protein [Tetrahymena thermophila SB210]|eukprot:XP_001014888.2 RING finger protein [Tetrahymena thermophila SB210]